MKVVNRIKDFCEYKLKKLDRTFIYLFAIKELVFVNEVIKGIKLAIEIISLRPLKIINNNNPINCFFLFAFIRSHNLKTKLKVELYRYFGSLFLEFIINDS